MYAELDKSLEGLCATSFGGEIMVSHYRERPIEAAAMRHARLFDGELGEWRIFLSCPASTPQMLNVYKFSTSCSIPIWVSWGVLKGPP